MLSTRRLLLLSITFVGISLALFASNAHSFDGNREGFVFGFGAGLGILTSPGLDHSNQTGVQTDLTIGVGLSDNVEFHYTGKQFWYSEGGEFFSLANPMIGLTYYLKPQAPSGFLSASAGPSIGVAFWEGGGGLLAGPGFHVGVGYEFSPHWNIKFDAVTAYMPASDWRLLNWIISINFLGY